MALMCTAVIFFSGLCGMTVKAASPFGTSEKQERIDLYNAVAVMDTKELVQMAVNGVDELARDSGINWEPEIEIEGTDICDVHNYSTSQLINKYIYDGEIYNQYALTSITTANVNQYGDPAVSGYGCTMRTTMVVTWNASYNRAALNYQATWVSGVSPTVLVMTNKVDMGWDTGKSYVNSKEVLNPSGTYTLTSPSSEMVGASYGSELWCHGIVYFTGGNSLTSSYILDPGGILPAKN